MTAHGAAPGPGRGEVPEEERADAAGSGSGEEGSGAVPDEHWEALRARGERGPWYAEGLRFECTACGKCCHNHGDGYQYVWSTRAERRALAKHFGLSLRAFEAEYCTPVDGDLSFTSRGDACVFLEDGQCSVYALRPKQCSSFPFWPELLADPDTWERDVASFCPGAGQGPVHDLGEIRRRMKNSGF